MKERDMNMRRKSKRLSEFEVKRYFYDLIGQARELQHIIIDLSKKGINWDDISLETAIWHLERQYRNVCNPGAQSTEGMLEELQKAAIILVGVVKSLRNATKQINQLSKKITCKKSEALARNLWYR